MEGGLAVSHVEKMVSRSENTTGGINPPAEGGQHLSRSARTLVTELLRGKSLLYWGDLPSKRAFGQPEPVFKRPQNLA